MASNLCHAGKHRSRNLKVLLLLFGLSGFHCFCSKQHDIAGMVWDQPWNGKLLEVTDRLNEYPIEMRLSYIDGKIEGQYAYKKIRKPIIVSGKVTGPDTLELMELDKNGSERATFSGRFQNGLLAGTWTEEKRGRKLWFYVIPENFIIEKKKLTSSRFAGQYAYSFKDGPEGFLELYPVSDRTMIFKLDVHRGPPSYNMGGTFGTLNIVGQKGKYTSENGKCNLEFSLSPNIIKINHVDSETLDCGYGFGVYPMGDFQRKSLEIPLYFREFGEIVFPFDS